MPGRATGSSPRRSPFATASSTAGWSRRRRTYTENRKRVYYLSVEFLIGRLLFDALEQSAAWSSRCATALAELGVDLDELRALEPDAALGNGGLGRLAACFMDSMASLDMPAYGYGIRYDYGLFRQAIADGWQHEIPEDWLAVGNPVGVRAARGRPIRSASAAWSNMSAATPTTARGTLVSGRDACYAVAYDTPVVGWRGRHVNTLRLWSARATDPLQLAAFNQGDYVGALASARAGRGDLARALSERRDGGRPGAAAAAGILLHLGIAAGPRAPPSRRSTATSRRCRTTPRSSSTTRIRRSRSPS